LPQRAAALALLAGALLAGALLAAGRVEPGADAPFAVGETAAPGPHPAASTHPATIAITRDVPMTIMTAIDGVRLPSRAGQQPAPGRAALVYLTRLLDLELRPLGIRVNAVTPQILDTATNRQYLLPHAVTLDAVADIIAYLVSDAAAPVSGAVVPVYGA